MRLFASLIAGLLFGLGLVISGMINPAKIINFLDLFGSWDPSLAFVMGGAIAVAYPGFKYIGLRPRPFFHDVFHLPTSTDLDPQLLSGAAMFGVGWGLGGFCPGPAMAALPLMSEGTLAFIPAMLVGMLLARFVKQRRSAVSMA